MTKKKVNTQGRHHRPWTKEEQEYLEDQWGLLSTSAIATKLGRTVAAVVVQKGRMGLVKTDAFMTASEVARIFGVPSVNTVTGWIRRGQLKAVRSTVGPKGKQFWKIDEDGLKRFIREYPQAFDPTRIDRLEYPYWRNLVDAAKPADLPLAKRRRSLWTPQEDEFLLTNYRHMTQPELGQKLNRTTEAVHYRLMLLRAKGRHAPYKGTWVIREKNGTAHAPKSAKPWTAEEDRYIQENWGRVRCPGEIGWGDMVTVKEIADHLKRHEVSVWRRANHLGVADLYRPVERKPKARKAS